MADVTIGQLAEFNGTVPATAELELEIAGTSYKGALSAILAGVESSPAGTPPPPFRVTGDGVKMLHGPFQHNMGTEDLSVPEWYYVNSGHATYMPGQMSAAEEAVIDALGEKPEARYGKAFPIDANSCYVLIDTSNGSGVALADTVEVDLYISAPSGSYGDTHPLYAITGYTATKPTGESIVATYADLAAFEAAVVPDTLGVVVQLLGWPVAASHTALVSVPNGAGAFEWSPA